MAPMTTLEASFLEAEDADRHLNLAIGALAILEGPNPGQDALTAALSERIGPIPRFTQKVRA